MKSLFGAFIVVVALLGLLCQQCAVALSPLERAQAMLSQMTLDEKIKMMYVEQHYSTENL